MKNLCLVPMLALFGACATSQPARDGAPLALQTIRDAEVAGAAKAEGKPAELLADAKSEIAYSQHLPGDPEHAQRLRLRAEADAELALVLTRCQSSERGTARAETRRDVALSAVAQ
jgi:hypothetical protein